MRSKLTGFDYRRFWRTAEGKLLRPRLLNDNGRVSYQFGKVAFVRHPIDRKIWLRVHICAAYVTCPDCESEASVPCRGKSGFMVATHFTRRQKMKRKLWISGPR